MALSKAAQQNWAGRFYWEKREKKRTTMIRLTENINKMANPSVWDRNFTFTLQNRSEGRTRHVKVQWIFLKQEPFKRFITSGELTSLSLFHFLFPTLVVSKYNVYRWEMTVGDRVCHTSNCWKRTVRDWQKVREEIKYIPNCQIHKPEKNWMAGGSLLWTTAILTCRKNPVFKIWKNYV